MKLLLLNVHLEWNHNRLKKLVEKDNRKGMDEVFLKHRFQVFLYILFYIINLWVDNFRCNSKKFESIHLRTLVFLI